MSNQPYIVSARKYRPATFSSVVGQKTLTETLKNAIQSGRVAQAYLFCGPRGVGKTSCARIFAKTLNCLSPTPDGEACGVCESCVAMQHGNSFNIIELDAASNNSVDDIRSLTEQVNVPPTLGKYRIFIIDEVHMLSSQAFNAFLKTLEEPPKYVIFILATTEKHKVIPTILSRCQIYDFKRITIRDMVDHLEHVAKLENIQTDSASLNVIARKADGAMRDALSIFDQVAASSFGNITYESTIASLNVLDYDYYFRLVEAFKNGNVQEALMIYKEIRDRGFDSLVFVNGLANHIRDLMVAFSPSTSSLLEVADDVAGKYTEQAQSLPIDWHYAAMKVLSACDAAYRTASGKQFLVELTLIRLCQLLNPPTPPFDRVEDDTIPLRDPVVPPNMSYTPVARPRTASTHTAASSTYPPIPNNSSDESEKSIVSEPEPVTPVPETTTEPTAPPSSNASVAPAIHSDSRRRNARNKLRAASAFRISDEENTDSEGKYDRHHEPVTPEAFLKSWEEYIMANSDQKVLTSAMRSFSPTQKNADTFCVKVEHPAQYQALSERMNHLLEFLRSRLSNDFLVLDVEIDASARQANKVRPEEILKKIASDNPALAQFIGGLDCELE